MNKLCDIRIDAKAMDPYPRGQYHEKYENAMIENQIHPYPFSGQSSEK